MFITLRCEHIPCLFRGLRNVIQLYMERMNYIWIEGEDNLLDFCKRRNSQMPQGGRRGERASSWPFRFFFDKLKSGKPITFIQLLNLTTAI